MSILNLAEKWDEEEKEGWNFDHLKNLPKKYEITMTNQDSGEEWNVVIDGKTKIDAFQKFLRRKYVAEYLIDNRHQIFWYVGMC